MVLGLVKKIMPVVQFACTELGLLLPDKKAKSLDEYVDELVLIVFSLEQLTALSHPKLTAKPKERGMSLFRRTKLKSFRKLLDCRKTVTTVTASGS